MTDDEYHSLSEYEKGLHDGAHAERERLAEGIRTCGHNLGATANEPGVDIGEDAIEFLPGWLRSGGQP